MLGLPTYGRSFTIHNPLDMSVGVPASAGYAGDFTREEGFLAYYEVSIFITF